MKNVSKLALFVGLSAVVATTLAGCGSGDKTEDSAVTPAIQSPVMNKADDSKMAGADTTSNAVPTPNTSATQ